jgi:hypothetical protein
MESSLYPTFEYCVRALRLKSIGLPASAVERYTGIPHNLQDELLPSLPLTADDSSSIEDRARDGMKGIAEDQLYAIQSANRLRDRALSNAPPNTAEMTIAVDLREAMEEAGANNTPATAKRINPESLRSGIVGRLEVPAPTESSLSVALRFLASNAFTLKQGEEAIGMWLYQVRVPGIFGRPIIVTFDEEQTIGEWSETLDRRLAYELPHATALLLSHTFRFCHHCLARQFHSAIHQLAVVETCPLHGSPVLNACVHCATVVGPIESVLKRGYKAYICAKCDKPICGNAPLYRASREFRQILSTSGEHLRPFMDWFSGAQSKLWLFEQLLQQNPGASDWGEWGGYERRLSDSACSLHPLPLGAATRASEPLYMLPWSLRLSTCNAASGLPGENAGPASVYLSTLRAIASWSSGGRIFDEADFADVGGNNIIRRDKERLKGISFALFRMIFERNNRFPRGWDSLEADDMQYSFSKFSSLGRVRRLPEKAVLLASFSTILSGTLTPRSEPLQFSRLRWLAPERAVPFVQLPEATGPGSRLPYAEGAVLAPTIANFPIAEFYPQARLLD